MNTASQISEDKAWTPNPNGDRNMPKGTPECINKIDLGGEPHVLRNVARYYAAKDERWADAMAKKLRSAARQADNDNRKVRRAA